MIEQNGMGWNETTGQNAMEHFMISIIITTKIGVDVLLCFNKFKIREVCHVEIDGTMTIFLSNT